ncbi:translation protein SH3-like domain-containing protein, partial [Blyttiomyces helicus]
SDNRESLFKYGASTAVQPGSVLLVERIASRSQPRPIAFAGVLIAIRRRGIMTNITLRNYVLGTGVEMVFPIFSPLITRIKVLRRVTGMTDSDRLYWLRQKP